jgi:hypothetical protein
LELHAVMIFCPSTIPVQCNSKPDLISLHAMLKVTLFLMLTVFLLHVLIPKPPTRAYSHAVNSESPTTTAAPAFETLKPPLALFGFELVLAGPPVVVLAFPLAVPAGFGDPVSETPLVVGVASPPKILLRYALKNCPVGKTVVSIAVPPLLSVSVCPSPTHVVAILPTGAVVAELLPLNKSSSQPDPSSSSKRIADSEVERLSRRQTFQ